MSAARLIMSIVIGSVAVLAVGTILVFGFSVVEPFSQHFGNPPESLGWGDPASTTLRFASLGGIGMLLVLVVWLITRPVRQDRRQQFR